MSARPKPVLVGLAAVFVIAGFVLWDYLVLTDEERIETFVDLVTGEVTPERVDAALAYVDPGRLAIEVDVWGESRVYTDNETFRREARRAISRLAGQSLRAAGEQIQVESNVATVTMRVFTQRGMRDAEFRLEKRQDEWLVSRVRVK